MSRLLQGFRHALRACASARLASGFAVLAFALGIGVTTAVFSIFYGVLLKPLPFPEPDALVSVYDTQPACQTCPASFPKYLDWKSRNRVFSAMGGTLEASLVMTGASEPLQISARRATASLMDVFRVQPALGRWFDEAEDRPGGPKVAVLSHEFWTDRLGRQAEIIGRRLVLDGDPYDVIGVMPAGFSIEGGRDRVDMYLPLARTLDPATRGSHFLVTYARLQPGVTVERAAADMRALGVVLAQEFGGNHGIDVRAYREVIVGNVRPQLRLLLGAVVAVLLIGCANVANLLLAAGLARRRELGIRLALGARVSDLARQLVGEALLLAAAGGVLGLLLAVWLLRVFVALAGAQLPRADAVSIDARVLVFIAVVTIAVGVVCGLWPLARLRVRDLTSVVREGDTRTASAGDRVGSGLVVAEIALAFALLAAGGLLVKNLLLLQNRDAGIRTERVMTFDVAPSGPRYAEPAATRALYRDLYERLTQVGGVQKVGAISHLPMRRFGWNGEMQIEGKAPWTADAAPLVEYRWFAGDYFEAMGIPLVEGRWLDRRDGQGTTSVLINQAMAEKFWPGERALGRRFGQGTDRSRWWEVVGVVGNVRSGGLARAVPFEFYRHVEQSVFNSQTFVVRAAGDDPTALVPAVKEIVRSLDPSLPVTSIRTMEQVVAASVGRQRLVSAMAALFAALAGLLAMVGVFGVMTYNVRRQRRELGIRLALGADGAAVRRLILGRGLKLAAIGSAAGALGAWLLGGTLRSMLNDVTPADPQVLALTVAAVFAAAVLAAWLPARSAGRTDPLVVLRD